jgi:hypothetical protein
MGAIPLMMRSGFAEEDVLMSEDIEASDQRDHARSLSAHLPPIISAR